MMDAIICPIIKQVQEIDWLDWETQNKAHNLFGLPIQDGLQKKARYLLGEKICGMLASSFLDSLSKARDKFKDKKFKDFQNNDIDLESKTLSTCANEFMDYVVDNILHNYF